MSLFNYVSACGGFLDEIRSAITRAESAALHQDLTGMTLREWAAWIDQHSSEISSFVESTPNVRNSKKKWKDPTLRGRLILAAYQHVHQAQVLLRVIIEHSLEPGGSYRLMASIAGDAYNKILFDEEFPEWPFDGDSPFL